MAPGKKLYYDPDKLRTVFVKETDEEVEAAKLAAQKPFKRVSRDVWVGGGFAGAGAPVITATDATGKTSEVPATSHALPLSDTCHDVIIPMPLRPVWQAHWGKAQLEANEEMYFRQYLIEVYARYGGRTRLNHFEHNLEVWRQLWRVCERSDILLVLVDIRHPLFHFPPALYHYVTRHMRKPMILLLNKIDLVERAVVDRYAFCSQTVYRDAEDRTIRVMCVRGMTGGLIGLQSTIRRSKWCRSRPTRTRAQ